MATGIAIPKNLHPIARIIKSYGIDGELIIRLTDSNQDEINTTEPVYVYFDGLPVPFCINSIKRKGNSQALIQLRPITARITEEIIGKDIFSATALISQESEDISPKLLIGFSLIDANGKLAGTISEFYDYPNNPCIEIKNSTNESHLIPFAEDLILNFFPEKSQIQIDIPEGLIS